MLLPIHRLEQYSLRYPQEVLRLKVQKQAGEDEIIVFKGFSSSLVWPTDFDPEIPLITEQETILSIDRLGSPYQGENSSVIEAEIPWQTMAQRLQELGL